MSGYGVPGTKFDSPSEAAAYNRAAKGATVYGPMICICPVPDADPARNFGECFRCRRKPLALMAVSS